MASVSKCVSTQQKCPVLTLGESKFYDYERADVLTKLRHEIERIEIDGSVFYRTWHSYAEFTSWLMGSDLAPQMQS